MKKLNILLLSFLFSCSYIDNKEGNVKALRFIDKLIKKDKGDILEKLAVAENKFLEYKPKKDIENYSFILDNTKFELFRKKGKENKEVLYYVHGGGFLYGLSTLYKILAENILNHISDVDLVFVDYKTLPNNFYPSANEDVDKGLNYLQEKYEKVYMMGDSAGGNLVVSNTLKRKDNNQKMADALVLISPFLDVNSKVDSRKRNIKSDPLVGSLKENYHLTRYLTDNEYFKTVENKGNPYVSPIYADFKNFPRTYIQVNEDEVLADDSLIAYQKMKEQKVEVFIEKRKGLYHVYILNPKLKETDETLKNIAKFLKGE